MKIGSIVLIESKKSSDKVAETLSYGHPNEPSPDLLLRRDRATLFETEAQARAALTSTLQICTKNGHEWPKKFIFKIVSVESNPS